MRDAKSFHHFSPQTALALSPHDAAMTIIIIMIIIIIIIIIIMTVVMHDSDACPRRRRRRSEWPSLAVSEREARKEGGGRGR
jgi:heme/copper-type cytochrome/quinol oxidase subunit 2